ncbi:MAG: glycosyl hydrolase 108 family protein [Thermodesulfobacteriota bacterium]
MLPVDPETERFRRCLAVTLRLEGGFVADPTDPGGPTNLGLAGRHHPDLDLAGLTREKTEAIYRERYWTPLHCGRLPDPAALIVFDSAVQHGWDDAAQWLQEAVNAELGPKSLAVDKVIGSQTLALAAKCAPGRLAGRILARRLDYLMDQARRQPRKTDGFLNRVAALLQEAARW